MLRSVERAVLEDRVVLTGKTMEKQTRGKIFTFLADDHKRLEYSLRQATAQLCCQVTENFGISLTG